MMFHRSTLNLESKSFSIQKKVPKRTSCCILSSSSKESAQMKLMVGQLMVSLGMGQWFSQCSSILPSNTSVFGGRFVKRFFIVRLYICVFLRRCLDVLTWFCLPLHTTVFILKCKGLCKSTQRILEDTYTYVLLLVTRDYSRVEDSWCAKAGLLVGTEACERQSHCLDYSCS